MARWTCPGRASDSWAYDSWRPMNACSGPHVGQIGTLDITARTNNTSTPILLIIKLIMTIILTLLIITIILTLHITLIAPEGDEWGLYGPTGHNACWFPNPRNSD